MNNALAYLWPLMDAPRPIVAAHIVAAWPAGVHQRLLELGFLVQAADADRVLCPECQGHIEEVIASDGPGGTPRFYVACPEVSRAHVPAATRRQWAVNAPRFAEALAATLKLTGVCTELAPNRAWRLGCTTWQDATRDVVLARGLHWGDAATVRAVIVRARKPIVFVPDAKPSDDLWRGRVPPILALSQVATDCEKGIDVDPLEIAAAIQDAGERVSDSGTIAIGMDQLKSLIRQQVKAEGKTGLIDDILVAAYRQHGTVREAAAYLSRETGQEVSKDQVHRALQRSGGVAVVLNNHDSPSVVRSRPSARGRKTKKPTTSI